MSELFLTGKIDLRCGDSRDVLRGIADCSIDSIVTDPPYALVSIVRRFGKPGSAPVKVPEDGSGAYARASGGFMGKQWDTGETAFAVEFWAECLRVLKPGGHVVAFSGTRTYHRMACAIEDAGFEVRDMLSWLYGSGFPKSHDVSKGIDRAAGAEREVVASSAAVKRMIPGADQHKGGWEKNNGREFVPTITAPATDATAEWQGWGTALKPACEPICFGRKPLVGTVAANVLEHGTGAINIDGCRIGTDTRSRSTGEKISKNVSMAGANYSREIVGTVEGRWPANIVHDGSEEVVTAFPSEAGAFAPVRGDEPSNIVNNVYGARNRPGGTFHDDSGSAARFFYTAKADADDRIGSKHPTVKPVDLMQWLVRLVTPKGGLVLDPFAGTGTTGEAAFREGMRAVLIERESEYQADIRRRMALIMSGPEERRRESIKAKFGELPFEENTLFAGLNPPADPDTPPGVSGDKSTASSRTNDRANRNEAVTP